MSGKMLRCIFAATESEVESAIEKFGFQLERAAPFRAYSNGSARLVISGIGLVNAALAYCWAERALEFSDSANIGAAGDVSGKFALGDILRVGRVACVEPFDGEVFELPEGGAALASSARPAVSARARERASKFGDIVDMEAYSLVSAARLFSKDIEVVKLVTDFSPECDIRANIVKLRHLIAGLDEFWTK